MGNNCRVGTVASAAIATLLAGPSLAFGSTGGIGETPSPSALTSPSVGNTSPYTLTFGGQLPPPPITSTSSGRPQLEPDPTPEQRPVPPVLAAPYLTRFMLVNTGYEALPPDLRPSFAAWTAMNGITDTAGQQTMLLLREWSVRRAIAARSASE